MTLLEATFGLVGAAAFSAMIFYVVKILENFGDHEEFSMTMFFLREEVLNAFKILLVTGLVFSAGMIMAATALVVENPVVDNFSKIGSLVVWAGLLHFFRAVYQATCEQK